MYIREIQIVLPIDQVEVVALISEEKQVHNHLESLIAQDCSHWHVSKVNVFYNRLDIRLEDAPDLSSYKIENTNNNNTFAVNYN